MSAVARSVFTSEDGPNSRKVGYGALMPLAS